MTAVLSHRGPDDSGLHMSAPLDGLRVGLGNRRLAVLDPSPAGHMPMSDPERKLWITHNGEIYTRPQLCMDLESRGYRFRSKSESEALNQSEGPEFVRRNGMFAIAIRDQQRGQLVPARDHFEFLYYFRQADRFAFRSEGFGGLPGCPRRPTLELWMQTFIDGSRT